MLLFSSSIYNLCAFLRLPLSRAALRTCRSKTHPDAGDKMFATIPFSFLTLLFAALVPATPIATTGLLDTRASTDGAILTNYSSTADCSGKTSILRLNKNTCYGPTFLPGPFEITSVSGKCKGMFPVIPSHAANCGSNGVNVLTSVSVSDWIRGKRLQ